MSPSSFSVRFFEVVSDVGIWVIFILIEVILSDRNIWQDQKVKNLHKIVFDEHSLSRHESYFTHVFNSRSNQFLTLFGCLHLIILNRLPNAFEHWVTVVFEILSKLEGIEIDQRDNFSSGLDDLCWHRCKCWIVLCHNELACRHYLCEICFIAL